MEKAIFDVGGFEGVEPFFRLVPGIAAARGLDPAVEPFRNVFRAEKYRQRYFEKNGLPSCLSKRPD